jgi:DNA-binding NtrC family response regulator
MNKPYILCVDDDKTILMSLRAQLKYRLGNDFNYEIAESAEEAWEVIDELKSNDEHIAVIISDWIMPEVKGDEFLIAVHAKYPNIIKLILTGHADEKAITRAKEQANLSGCLVKPWRVDELIAIIESSLRTV